MLTNCLILFSLINLNFNNLDSLVQNYLNEKLKQFTRYEFQIVSKPQKILKDNYQIKIDEEKEFKLSTGYGYIPVFIVSKNNSISYSILTTKLKLFANVLVVKNKIESGEDLNQSNFIIEERDVTSCFQIPYEAYENLNYFRSKTRVAKGSILLERMIEKIPLIKKGDKVVASLSNGIIEISLEGTARQNGCIGDKIKVELNNKIFTAEIKESNKVVITN